MQAPGATAWRAVLAALVLAICWLAFDPAPPRGVDTGWDKANHALAFAAVGAAARLAFPAARTPSLVAGGMAYGAFIEIVQSQVPGRSAEWADLLADAVGLALGLMLPGLRPRR